MTFWLVVVAVVLVVVVVAYRYDRKHRRLGDSPAGSQMSRAGLDTKGAAEDKSTRWNAGGGMTSNGH
jgi:hypothetical protein